MPPDDRPQLPARPSRPGWSSPSRVAGLQGELQVAQDPGRVTIRRLNRAEYNNTIRDLVGVDFRPADDFPSDDVGYGFDNIGDVLTLPPILFEKYLAAAEKIAERGDRRRRRARRGRPRRCEAEALAEPGTAASTASPASG